MVNLKNLVTLAKPYRVSFRLDVNQCEVVVLNVDTKASELCYFPLDHHLNESKLLGFIQWAHIRLEALSIKLANEKISPKSDLQQRYLDKIKDIIETANTDQREAALRAIGALCSEYFVSIKSKPVPPYPKGHPCDNCDGGANCECNRNLRYG